MQTSESEQPEGFKERRVTGERRSIRGAFRLAAAAGSLKRRRGRRKTDLEQGFYTDHHDAPLLLVALSIVLFSLLDSIFTLQLIARGAEELNPLMAHLINIDVQVFAWTKTLVTASVLVLLVAHANHVLFGLFRVRRVLQLGLAGYVCLVAYQVVLMVMFEPLPTVVLSG